MDFARYRRSKRWTYADVASFLGLAQPSSVRKHELGINIPSAEVLDRYRTLTAGQVTEEDFMVVRRRYLARQKIDEKSAEKSKDVVE